MGRTNAQHARDAAIIDDWVYAQWTSGETQADIARSMGCNKQRIGQRVARELARQRRIPGDDLCRVCRSSLLHHTHGLCVGCWSQLTDRYSP